MTSSSPLCLLLRLPPSKIPGTRQRRPGVVCIGPPYGKEAPGAVGIEPAYAPALLQPGFRRPCLGLSGEVSDVRLSGSAPGYFWDICFSLFWDTAVHFG